jgi:hypothetical protein
VSQYWCVGVGWGRSELHTFCKLSRCTLIRSLNQLSDSLKSASIEPSENMVKRNKKTEFRETNVEFVNVKLVVHIVTTWL